MELERLFLAWLLVLACICCTLSAPIAADVDESESSGSGSGESEGSGSKKEDIASSADGEQGDSSGDSSDDVIEKRYKIASVHRDDDDDYYDRKYGNEDTDRGRVRCVGGGCGEGGEDEHSYKHHEDDDHAAHHHTHGHHEHEHEHHHHGHHHGFIHEWGQEEGGEHHGHEGRGHQEHCHHHSHEHEHEGKGHEGHETKDEGSQRRAECDRGDCDREKDGDGWRRHKIFKDLKIPTAYHCRDIISKSGDGSATKRFCIPVGKRGALAMPELPPPNRKRDKIERASKKQTVHVGYGYASGDNYRLGYQAGGMGGLASNFGGPIEGSDPAMNGEQNMKRSRISPRQQQRGIMPKSFVYDVRAAKRERLSGFNPELAQNGGGSSTPYGHPVTHPGFTTMAYPGQALATTDVRNRILRSKRQTYENLLNDWREMQSRNTDYIETPSRFEEYLLSE